MACFISTSLFMAACSASMLAVLAMSAASPLAMFSFIVVCILAIWAFICSGLALVSAGVVAAGVAVTVTAGVAVTGGVGAGVAVGSGIGAGVTVGVGAGVAVGAAFWARAGIHMRESATIDTRTGLGRFMGVLLDSGLDGWRRVAQAVLKARGQSGPRLVQEALSWRHATTALSAVLHLKRNPGLLWLRSMVNSAQSRRRLA